MSTGEYGGPTRAEYGRVRRLCTAEYGRVRAKYGDWPEGVQYEYGSTAAIYSRTPYPYSSGNPPETSPGRLSACLARVGHATEQCRPPHCKPPTYAPGRVVMRGMEP